MSRSDAVLCVLCVHGAAVATRAAILRLCLLCRQLLKRRSVLLAASSLDQGAPSIQNRTTNVAHTSKH